MWSAVVYHRETAIPLKDHKTLSTGMTEVTLPQGGQKLTDVPQFVPFTDVSADLKVCVRGVCVFS